MNFGSLAFDYTLFIVMGGSAILGIVAGVLGCFAVLRRQSLLGDAISHAALPGVALAFLLTQSKHPLVLIIGALIAGWIGTLVMMLITKTTRIKQDAALGIVLSVFFGFGVFLLTIIQKLPTATKAGLNKFLFGNASTLLLSDVLTMSVLGVLVLILTVLFWKEFKLLTFDHDFAQSLGFPTLRVDIFLTTLIVISIVIGLQTVGVVLMSAMLIAPAVAARQWTDRLAFMVVLSGIFGALSGVLGSLVSSSIAQVPTGPMIVVFISIIVFCSLFFAPHRGLLFDYIRHRKHRSEVRVKRVLYYLYSLSQSHHDLQYAHEISVLKAIDPTGIERALEELKREGFVETKGSRWHLTPKGLSAAESIHEAPE